MSESLNKYRAHFKKTGQQREWLVNLRKRIHIRDIAHVSRCSERTIRDWQREKYSMCYEALQRLCDEFSRPFPQVEKNDSSIRARESGKKGAHVTMKKYGRVPVNEAKRKIAWRNWWHQNQGRHSKILQTKNITKPRLSAEVAEFVGILIGDGGISNYQVTVTLHSVDDQKYGEYVSKLISKLFNVPVSVRPRKNMQATDYVISRKQLVDFCATKLGLKIGNKLSTPLSIPQWIINDKNYARACVRGLMDTDGSVYPHTYNVNGKEYVYKKICFTSASNILRTEVADILNANNIKVSCFANNVRIESQRSVKQYLQKIGFNNSKHLKRIHN